MKEEAREAAERLVKFFESMDVTAEGQDEDSEHYDPLQDARKVKQALEG